ncbi:30S ribosome-binding factor RbfA [Nannocystaceae bacterium ST9]
MSRRQHRVEELLRREIAQMLLRGELRDPRLQPASAVGITGVDVSADLSVATVYVDVLSEAVKLEPVLAALRAAGGLIRHKLSERVQIRRSPELRFAYDQAIARGARVEAILAEIGSLPASEPIEVASEPESSEPAESSDEG